MLAGEDRRRKQCRIGSARRADGQRADRDPRGIWTIESNESTPLSVLLSTGTPSTGKIVIAASIPGRWAAPPAPAMISSSPRPSASRPY
jgi:hypothetical protein